jgi:hypothetical protein
VRSPTEPPRSAAPESDSEALDVTEQQEATWLLARERDVTAPPPSPQVAQEYAALENLLAHLPIAEQDHSWHAEVLRRAESAEQATPATPAVLPLPLWKRAKMRWITAGGLAGLASAAAAAMFLLRGPAPAISLTGETLLSSGLRGGENEAPAVGKMHRWTTSDLGEAELRVFDGDGELVGLCSKRTMPGVEHCTPTEKGGFELPIKLRYSGRYTAHVVTGAADLSLSLSREELLEADRDRARNVEIVKSDFVSVPR